MMMRLPIRARILAHRARRDETSQRSRAYSGACNKDTPLGELIYSFLSSIFGTGFARQSVEREIFGSPIPARAFNYWAEEVNMFRSEVHFQDRKMFMYVLTAIAMSGYDAVATMQHIGRGVAAEGNPLMQSLIEQHAVLFFFVKMAITAMGLLVCYSFSHKRTARMGIRLAVAAYSIVTVYHAMIVIFG
jgi:hypothetical protein